MRPERPLLPAWLRLSLVAALWALLFTAVYANGPRHEAILDPLAAIPLLATGLLLGWRAGLGAAVLAPSVIIALRLAQGSGETLTSEVERSFTGWMIALGLGFGSGWMAEGLRRERRLRREAAERQALVLETQAVGHVGSWEIDLATGAQTGTEENHRLFGLQPGEPETRETILSHIHPDDRAPVLAALDRMAQGRRERLELRVLLPDGGVRVLDCRGEGRLDGGRPRILGFSQDVTERKAAEAAAARRQAMLEEAQALTHVGSWEWTPGSDRSLRSAEATRVLGIDPADATSRPFFERVHPEDAPSLRGALQRSLQEGAEYDLTLRLRVRGQWRHVRVRGRPSRRAPDGAVVQVGGTVQDVTEEVLASAALRASEERYRLLSENASDFVQAFDLRGVCTYASPSCRSVLGYGPEELVGNDGLHLLHPEDRASMRAGGFGAERPDGSHVVEMRARHKAGMWVWVETVSRPIVDAQGRVRGHVAASRSISQRKEAELALTASEERFRQMAENSDQIFFIADAATRRMLYVSPAYHRVTGHDPGPLYADMNAWVRHVLDEDRPRLLEAMGRFGSTGRFDEEFRLRAADGRVLWMRDRVNPVFDEAGALVRLAGITEDITQRKQAGDLLRRREALLAQAESIADVACWEADLRTGQAFWSDGAFRLFGLPRDSPMTFEAWLGCLHPEDRERAKAAAGSVPATGQPVEFECRVVRGDGSVRHTLNRTVPTVVDGRVVHLTGVNMDITERKEAHLRAADTSRRLASVIEASPLPIVQADASMQVTGWNPAAERLFGWSRAEVLGHPLFTVPETDRRLVEETHRELRAGRTVVREDVPRLRKDGSEVRVTVYLSPLVSEDGGFQGVMGIVLDLTAQKEVEAQRLKVQRLEEVAAFKTQFLNSAAHELATPLTPIKLQMASLRRNVFGTLTAPQLEAVGLLERNLDRLSRLVQDLLDAARLQSGRLRVLQQPVAPGRIAQDVVHSCLEKARQEGVSLATRGLSLDLTALGDEARLSQVLFNLVHNALKFTPRGGRIEVAQASAGDEVVLSVTDTGIGLTAEQIGRLFQPFTQVHDTLRHNVGGTGLGLYISQGIVEQHGGRLACHSDGPGRGTTFEVRLPLAVAVTLPSKPGVRPDAAR